MSLAWSSDGSMLALGQADGCVAVRDATGVPLSVLDGVPGVPVTSLSWSPCRRVRTAHSCAVLLSLLVTRAHKHEPAPSHDVADC